jgi:hypothetical protein
MGGMSRPANSVLILLSAVFLLSCFPLLFPSAAHAQLIKIEGGVSDILPSGGGSVSFKGPNYDGYVGIGDIGGVFRFGSFIKTTLGGYKFTVGDQSIAIGLPTDIFGADQYFLARGIGVNTDRKGIKIFVYAGTTALGFGTQFFQAAQSQIPVGMIFLQIPISDKLTFTSKNVGSLQQTSIQSLDWRPYKWLKTAVSGGIGSNQPYFASTVEADRGWIDVKAAYIQAGNRFRRLTTPSVYSTEADGGNILVTVKPYRSLVFTAGHENFLAPQNNDFNAPFQRASVDQLQSGFDIAHFRLGAGIFQAHSITGRNVADGFSVEHAITRHVEASVNYYQTLSGPRPHSSNLSANIREIISPKITLLQVINHTMGNTTANFGGSYTTNRISVNVDYQTLYMPFLQNPLVSGLNISLQLRIFGNFQVMGQTFRSQDGRLRYSAGASTLLTPHSHGGGEYQSLKLAKYVIRGHVHDERGAPIPGAALRIGNDVVVTNADGEFLLREKKSGAYSLTVEFEQFLNPLQFRVVTAPPTVTAVSEESAPDILVVLAPALFRKQP